jgi:hypothetical protein
MVLFGSEAEHLVRLEMENPMKNMLLAAFAAISLTAALAPLANAADFHNGSTLAGDAEATQRQQTGS